MKKTLINIFLLLHFFSLYSFDFNGVWSFDNFSIMNWHYKDKCYSWGNIREPIDCGFTIDLERNEIYTNYTWYLNIQIDYDNDSFSFINPFSNEKEKYFITIISDYEIVLETDVNNDSLLVAENIKSKDKSSIHYFKINGPKNSKILKTPLSAIINEDSDLFIKDYKGVIHKTGYLKKGQIVEVWGRIPEKISEISEVDFNFAIRTNNETGGLISPLKIEFIDDIIISGYGKKRN